MLCLALLGCGQKGPLVLPDAPKHKRTIPALPQPTKPKGDAPSTGEGTSAAPADKQEPDKPAQPPPSSP